MKKKDREGWSGRGKGRKGRGLGRGLGFGHFKTWFPSTFQIKGLGIQAGASQVE